MSKRPPDDEDEGESAQEDEAKSIAVDPNVCDIQHCVRAALDSGLLTTEGKSCPKKAKFNDADMHLKRKRPVDVGSSDEEAKRARIAQQEIEPVMNFAQMEDKAEITSVYHKPELSLREKEDILDQIIQEFGLADNEEQQMSLRIVSEHFI
ncbi:hypothetical protein C8R48DRAFT_769270 [Suillus tomentosus]|nr:hypothetical protein C8R48DRAFT_769270 [Suillus tomentosus]